MNSHWMFGALVTFIIGFVLTISLVGAIIGFPLIITSLIFLLVGLFVPSK